MPASDKVIEQRRKVDELAIQYCQAQGKTRDDLFRQVEKMVRPIYMRCIKGSSIFAAYPGHTQADLIQLAQMEILAILSKWGPDRNGFGAVLALAVRRRLVDLRRKLNGRINTTVALDARRELNKTSDGAEGYSRLSEDDTFRKVSQRDEVAYWLDQLKPIERQVVAGVAAGKKAREIGAELGVTKHKVESVICRMRERLAKHKGRG